MPSQRYRELVQPALIDVPRRSSSSGGYEAAQSIAQSLTEFRRIGNSVIGPYIKQNLEKTGSIAGAEAGASGIPELKAGLTAYGRAYNNAAIRSYAIREEADLEQQAARLEVEAGTNPQAFREGMAAIEKGVMAEAPVEARPIISEVYAKHTAAGLARIEKALANELREEDRALVNEQIARMTKRIGFLRSQDTLETYAESQQEEARLNLLISSSLADGTISETEAKVAFRETQRSVVFETVRERFIEELDNPYGDPVGFIEDLKEINRTSETLPPDQEEELERALLAELSERNSLRAAREAQERNDREARFQEGDRQATTMMLAGQLTQTDLLRMVRDEELSPAVGRTLLNELQSAGTRPAKSDPETLFRFETNLLSLTEEEITSERSLTWDDRSRLILKRRDEEQGWKGTQVAKEAFGRIDRALGLVPGMSTKLLSEGEARARDLAFTELYNRIDALPPEERQAALLSTAEEVIRTTVRERAIEEIDTAHRTIRQLLDQLANDDLSERERKVLDSRVQHLQNRIRELESKAGQ